MLAAIVTWLTSEGVGLLLGALGNLILDAWQSYQSNQAFRDLGWAQAAATTNAKTLETINAMDDVPRPSDDAVIGSLRSGNF